ncbi:MAG: lasso peptide biosynthesis B2 protein [Caldilineaceae bacterium]
MKAVYKFFQLSGSDRWLLLQAFVLLAAIQLGLYALPFLNLKRFLERFATLKGGNFFNNRPTADRIAWAVRVASGYIPKATCLPQALVTHFLLVRNGYPADLKIGAAKKQDGSFEAHAWVTSEQRIVMGALRDLDRYTPLSTLPRKG